jgi:hypothetical protein
MKETQSLAMGLLGSRTESQSSVFLKGDQPTAKPWVSMASDPCLTAEMRLDIFVSGEGSCLEYEIRLE